MVENDLDSTARHTEKANPSQQESLDSEVIPDPMEGEQTWPTEEELAEGNMGLIVRKPDFVIPVGLDKQIF